jgi:hypothetical protein
MRDCPTFALAAWYGVANDLGRGGGRAQCLVCAKRSVLLLSIPDVLGTDIVGMTAGNHLPHRFSKDGHNVAMLARYSLACRLEGRHLQELLK